MGRLSTAYRQKKRQVRSKAFHAECTKNGNDQSKNCGTGSRGAFPAVIDKVTIFVHGVVISVLDALASVSDVPGPSEDEMAAFVDNDAASTLDSTSSDNGEETEETKIALFTNDRETVQPDGVDIPSSDKKKLALHEAEYEISDLTRTRKARKKTQQRAKRNATTSHEQKETKTGNDGTEVCHAEMENTNKEMANSAQRGPHTKEDATRREIPKEGVKNGPIEETSDVAQSDITEPMLHRRARSARCKQKRREKAKAKKEEADQLAAEATAQAHGECCLIVFEDDPDSIFTDQVMGWRKNWLSNLIW
ncbi:hypothetical protein ACHAQH_007413 [Verticillium albo-atrum]